MYPPVFETCAADPDVQTNLGSPVTRLYAFGRAPDSPTYPYAVWQIITGLPENYIDKSPDTDQWAVQIDVYADSMLSARNAAQALRDAIEPVAYVSSFDGESRENDTLAYRYTFTVSWWQLRENSST